MKCGNCGTKSNHIKILVFADHQEERCHYCGRFSEAGGTRTDGLLTRNSLRVRRDSVMHEGDLLPPHEYDKHSRDVKPREDFIKQFPDRACETFSREELDKAGYRKLKKTCPIKDSVEHKGNKNKRLKEVM